MFFKVVVSRPQVDGPIDTNTEERYDDDTTYS